MAMPCVDLELNLKEEIKMDARELINALQNKLGTTSQVELAEVLGITVQTLINWKKKAVIECRTGG